MGAMLVGGQARAGQRGLSSEASSELEGRWSPGGHGKEDAAVPCSVAQGSTIMEEKGVLLGESAQWHCTVLPFSCFPNRGRAGGAYVPAVNSPEWASGHFWFWLHGCKAGH